MVEVAKGGEDKERDRHPQAQPLLLLFLLLCLDPGGEIVALTLGIPGSGGKACLGHLFNQVLRGHSAGLNVDDRHLGHQVHRGRSHPFHLSQMLFYGPPASSAHHAADVEHNGAAGGDLCSEDRG